MSKYSATFTNLLNAQVINKLREAKASIPMGHTPNDIIISENLAGWIDQMIDELANRGVKIDRPGTSAEPLTAAHSDSLRLTVALRESLKLQSHYAKLLNMHDGGKRIGFETVDEWIERLKTTGTLPE